MSALRDLSGWTLAFDLDGTLIDTAPDLIATANATLERHGYHHVTADVLRPEISFGSRRMLEVASTARVSNSTRRRWTRCGTTISTTIAATSPTTVHRFRA
jgi:phosphoglycolate phosphatase-like HAD superfamily hydrolase